MTVTSGVRTCTCGHPESEHNLRKPEGGCGACTQCYSLNAHLPHTWRRCRCQEFEARPPRHDVIVAEIAGEIEVIDAD